MSLYEIERSSAGDQDTDKLLHYGFMVWRTDGKGLLKGAISSMNAYDLDGKCYIEFALQAPTGDSSDFCNYTFPCVDMDQAVAIIDEYYVTLVDRYTIDNAIHDMEQEV